MQLIDSKPYINLDPYLPLDSLPDIIDPTIESYNYIHQNTWQRTWQIDGQEYNCNWRHKDKSLKTPQDFFGLELKNKTVAMMWILDLTTTGSYTGNCYDSIETPKEIWDQIELRKDLPASWDPMMTWLEDLKCFDNLGRVSLLITRPGIPTAYHRDTGQKDSEFVAHPHRQEFFWLNMTEGKDMYILDDDRNPIQFNCRSAFFNHHSWHGSHTCLPFWALSFKIEGIFNQDFRDQAGFGHLDSYYD